MKVQSYYQSTEKARAMAYKEQTKDIKGDIRVNIPNSLSALSDGGAGSGSGAALGPPSHGQLPYRQMKTQTAAIFRKYHKTALPWLQITYSGTDLKP